eukprot:5808-Heterococcus_DN1.PRE.1
MAPAELTAMSSNSLSALLSAVAGGCMALSLAALLMLSSSSSALSPSGERNGRTDVSSVSRLVAAGGVLLNSC